MWKRIGILLLALRFLFAQAGFVEGVVRNGATRQPLAGVSVSLIADEQKETEISGTTDSSGAFRIDAVAPGAYHVRFDKDRFGVAENDRSEKPVTIAAGASATVNQELLPLGDIRGVVLDGEGRPVPRITVDWIPISSLYNSGGVNTDAEGRFHIDDLCPGTYILRANPNRPALPERVAKLADLQKPAQDAALSRRPLYAPVYYPNSRDRLLATPITIVGGEEMTGMEIRMTPVAMYRVTGVVIDDRGRPAPGIKVKLLTANGSSGTTDSPPDALVISDANGAFAFPTVGPGEWQITAEQRQGESSLQAYAGISVSRHDVQAVQLRLEAAFSMTGRVETVSGSSTSGLKDIRVVLEPLERPREQEAMAVSSEDGTLQIRHIYPGRYRVMVYKWVPGYYLDSIRLGEGNVLGREIELGPGAPALRVVYRADAARVRGKVENADGATVILLPTDPALLQFPLASAKCDVFGRFEVNALRPGEYYILAFERIDLAPLRDPIAVSALIARAESLRVQPGEIASIDLKVIPWPR